jgi:hypothetical protein
MHINEKIMDINKFFIENYAHKFVFSKKIVYICCHCGR